MSLDLEPFLATACRDESGEWAKLGSSFRGALADYFEEQGYLVTADFIREADGTASCWKIRDVYTRFVPFCGYSYDSMEINDSGLFPRTIHLALFSIWYMAKFTTVLKGHPESTSKELVNAIQFELEPERVCQ